MTPFWDGSDLMPKFWFPETRSMTAHSRSLLPKAVTISCVGNENEVGSGAKSQSVVNRSQESGRGANLQLVMFITIERVTLLRTVPIR
ncbi:MAG: hypothetical protein CMM07_30175 [Rhodopirellula sp.]|nr:hypothetical protein [Rhodopirellula sp.]